MELFWNHKDRTQKLCHHTHQNENKLHAICFHLINQGTEILKAGAQGKVQLPGHVIDVYMLDILQEATGEVLSVLQQCSAGTLPPLQILPLLAVPAWAPPKFHLLTHTQALFNSTCWNCFLLSARCSHVRIFQLLLQLLSLLSFPSLNSCPPNPSNLRLGKPNRAHPRTDSKISLNSRLLIWQLVVCLFQ